MKNENKTSQPKIFASQENRRRRAGLIGLFFFFFSLSVFRFLLPTKDEAHCNNKKPFINSTTFWGNNNRKLGCFFRVPLVANEQNQGVSIP